MKKVLGFAFFVGNTLLPIGFIAININDINLENIFEAFFYALWLIGFFEFIVESQKNRDELNLLRNQKRKISNEKI